MNIEDLTLKQIKEITSLNLFAESKNKAHPFVGKYCIARCYSAGVHAGYVSEVDGDKAILTNSRRLHSWKGTGVALSGVANGELLSGQRVDTINPEIYLTGVIELIPCTEKSRVSIHDYK
jgi:ferredoxin-fold anticodon binding domain-containing protein